MASTKPAAAPSTVKAVQIQEYGDASKLQLVEAPRPELQRGQILVRVRYAGVNPADWKTREGKMQRAAHANSALPGPLTMGHDFSGEVVEQGDCAATFKPGERVFGSASGSYAEYAAAAGGEVAAMPEAISFEIAAALPTPGVTALQLIRDAVKAKPGDRILIHGAAGGVGSLATQIARAWGARVIGTASEEDIPYLRSLGAAEAIDYKKEKFEESVGKVDAVVDLVGGETLARSYAVVKRGGVIATAAGTIDQAKVREMDVIGIRLMSRHNAKDLAELASMVEQGRVKPRMGRVFSLEQAKEAQELSEKGHPKGKILLKVS